MVNWPQVPRVHLPRGQHVLAARAGPAAAHDITGGYRAASAAETLEGSAWKVSSQGYCFQVDLARRAIKAGYHVVEVPITFVERELGDSR